jgi:hypothetical protein
LLSSGKLKFTSSRRKGNLTNCLTFNKMFSTERENRKARFTHFSSSATPEGVQPPPSPIAPRYTEGAPCFNRLKYTNNDFGSGQRKKAREEGPCEEAKKAASREALLKGKGRHGTVDLLTLTSLYHQLLTFNTLFTLSQNKLP